MRSFRLGLFVLAFVALLCRAQAVENESAIVATVDGEPIPAGEFRLHLESHRAAVYSHFQNLRPIENTDLFWKADYHGDTPLAYLKRRALQDLTAIKVQQNAARSAGVDQDDPGFEAFRQRWAAENRRRATAMQNGMVVYGPEQLSEWLFYTREIEELTMRLKRYAEDHLPVSTDEEVRQYYELRKGERYRVPDTISAEVLTWQTQDVSEKRAAEKLLQKILPSAHSGKTLTECATSLPPSAALQVANWRIDSNTASLYGKTAPASFAAALSLQAGEVSKIVDAGSALILVQCHTREAGGFLSFERYRSTIRRDYLDSRYRAYVQGLAAKATVIINHPVYDGVE